MGTICLIALIGELNELSENSRSGLFSSFRTWDTFNPSHAWRVSAPKFVFFLTCATPCRIFSMAQYSISQAARLLEIHRATLHRWIERGVVPPPVSQEVAGSQLRYWTEDGLAKLREYKALHYRKKPRLKASSRRKRSN
jgi:MerR HTH family regulatory protein